MTTRSVPQSFGSDPYLSRTGGYRTAQEVPQEGMCFACMKDAPDGRVKRRYERSAYYEGGYSYGWYHAGCRPRDDRKPRSS